MQGSTTQLLDRTSGALQGMAAGDAIGRPAHGMDWRAIQDEFGRITGFVADDDPRWALATPAGRLSGHAIVSLALARRVGADGRKPMPRHLIDEILSCESLDSLPAQAAVARIRAGVEPSRSAVPELAGPDALYLAVPIGIANIGDPEAAFLAARAVAGPILLGPSLEAGQVLASAVAAALMPGAGASGAFEAALDLAPPSVGRVLQPAIMLAREHLGHPLAILTPMLHERFSPQTSDPHAPAMEALAIGMIACFLCDSLTEGAVLAAANYGGWSSASAAVAGALSGAVSGTRSIPASWMPRVETANPGLDVGGIADGLVRLIQSESARQRAKLDTVEAMSSA